MLLRSTVTFGASQDKVQGAGEMAANGDVAINDSLSGTAVGDTDSTLGQRLRQERRAQGRSIQDVAGGQLSPSLISRIERDHVVPSLDTLQYLADRLGRPVAYFLTGREERLREVEPEILLGSLESFLRVLLEEKTATTIEPAVGFMGGVAPPELVMLLAAVKQQAAERELIPSALAQLLARIAELAQQDKADSSELTDLFLIALRSIGVQLGKRLGDDASAGSLLVQSQGRTNLERLMLGVAEVYQDRLPDITALPPIADVLRERLGAAYHDVQRARTAGNITDALIAAGWGIGLFEARFLLQAYLDLFIAWSTRQDATSEAIENIEQLLRVSGFEPGQQIVLAAAEHALERQKTDYCEQLLKLLPEVRLSEEPQVRRMLAQLALSRGDLISAVEQWEALAEDRDVPPAFVIDTLLRAGMLLDEAQHPQEAQRMYRLAASLWQRMGPRSGAALPAPDAASRPAVRDAEDEAVVHGHSITGSEKDER